MYLSIFFALLGAAASVRAEETVLPRVEIGAGRAQQAFEDPADRLVIPREQLLRFGAVSLMDALRQAPGVSVTGRLGHTALRLQGLGEAYTQILLNGLPLPAGFALDSLSADLVDSIEILRLPTAATGAQAIGGTINIVLRKPRARASSELGLSLGGEGGSLSSGATLQWGDSAEQLAWQLPLSLSSQAAPAPMRERESGPWERHWLWQDSSRVTRLNLAPRLQWRLATDQSLLAQASLLRGVFRQLVDGSVNTLAGAAPMYTAQSSEFVTRSRVGKLDLQWTRRSADGGRQEWRASWQALLRDSDFAFHGIGAPAIQVQRWVDGSVDERSLTIGLRHEFAQAGAHQWRLGAELAKLSRAERRDETGTDLPAALLQGFAVNYRRSAVYIEDEWQWATDGAATLGLRWEQQRGLTMLSPIIQSRLRSGPHAQWRLGLARSFRQPSLANLLARRYTVDNDNSPSRPDTQGNPQLRAERAWALNLGWERAHAGHSLNMHGAVRRIEDVIVQTTQSDARGWVRMPVNRGRALVSHVELDARAPAPGGAGQWSLQLARYWSKVQALPIENARIDQQPAYRIALGLDHDWGGGWRAGLQLSHEGAVWVNRPEQANHTGPRRDLAVFLQWDPRPGMRLRLSGSRLLGQEQYAVSSAAGLWRESWADNARQWRLQLELR